MRPPKQPSRRKGHKDAFAATIFGKKNGQGARVQKTTPQEEKRIVGAGDAGEHLSCEGDKGGVEKGGPGVLRPQNLTAIRPAKGGDKIQPRKGGKIKFVNHAGTLGGEKGLGTHLQRIWPKGRGEGSQASPCATRINQRKRFETSMDAGEAGASLTSIGEERGERGGIITWRSWGIIGGDERSETVKAGLKGWDSGGLRGDLLNLWERWPATRWLGFRRAAEVKTGRAEKATFKGKAKKNAAGLAKKQPRIGEKREKGCAAVIFRACEKKRTIPWWFKAPTDVR